MLTAEQIQQNWIDLEETIQSLEFNTPEKWGGEVTLGDGQKFYLEPIPQPKLPITLRAKLATTAFIFMTASLLHYGLMKLRRYARLHNSYTTRP